MTLILTLILLLLPTLALAQPACTHFASPQGQGSSCTQQSPCTVASFWPLAGPGKVLCLQSGTYKGSDSMITPPAGVAGTDLAPITIRAERDGQVLLDAEHQRSVVTLTPGHDWFVLEGFDGTGGKEYGFRLNGSHIRGRRLIGYHGTSGQDDSHLFSVGRQVDVVVEDCAGWGTNIRKLFDGAQSQAEGQQSGWSGFRRCFGEWNDHPKGESQPSSTLQMGYRTRQQRFENMILTWDTTGDAMGGDGTVSSFYDCESSSLDMHGTALLGSLLYLRPGARFNAGSLATTFCTSNQRWRDVAAIVPPGFPGTRPFFWVSQTAAQTPQGNVCTNCLSVHDGTPSVNQAQAGWTLEQWREGRTVSAATGGKSAWEALPGLCREYVGGVLTDTKLWPWRMQPRITAARAAGGLTPLDVQAQAEAALGPLPASCKRDVAPEPPIPPEPPVLPAGKPLTCVGVQSAAGGVAIACVPLEGRR